MMHELDTTTYAGDSGKVPGVAPVDIRGLTLRHPWAFAIARLNKRVENRSWPPSRMGGNAGMWLAIHGGKVPRYASDDVAVEMEADIRALLTKWDEVVQQCTSEQRRWLKREWLPAERDGQVQLGDFVTPGIVAVAKLTAVSTGDVGFWQIDGQYHWHMEVTPLRMAVPHRGAQGLWQLEPAALARVQELYLEARASQAVPQ